MVKLIVNKRKTWVLGLTNVYSIAMFSITKIPKMKKYSAIAAGLKKLSGATWLWLMLEFVGLHLMSQFQSLD